MAGISGFLSTLGGSVNQYTSGIVSGALGGLVGSATNALAQALGMPGTAGQVSLSSTQDASARITNTYKPSSAYLVTINQSAASGGSNKVQAYFDGDSFGFGVGGSYDAPFAQGLLGMFGAPMLEQLATIAGVKTVTKDMTALLWQGATRPAFDIPLIFVEDIDPGVGTPKLITQINTLAAMVLPTTTPDGFLNAPGPQRNFDAASQALESQANQLYSAIGNAGKSTIGLLQRTTTASQAITSYQNAGSQFAQTFTNTLSAFTAPGNIGTISITIGNFLSLESVIIDSMDLNVDFQFDTLGRPMVARTRIHCQPYKIWAADDFVNALTRQPGGSSATSTPYSLQTFPLNSQGAIANAAPSLQNGFGNG